MGVGAILVKWPRFGKQTFVPLTHWGSMWNLASIGPVVSEEKTFEAFSLHEFMKTIDPWDRAILDPRAITWKISTEVYKMKPHTKYQKPGSSSFRQEDF